MCGIAGMIDWSGRPIDIVEPVAMARAQSHRGPDGEGGVFFTCDRPPVLFTDLDDPSLRERTAGSTAALVHRRLAIIDLSPRGAQPMSDESGRYWITFNGEVYNYVELMGELRGAGVSFRSRSDTEVVLRGFIQWGPECVLRFNGMFAFAVWDAHRRVLFCARDHLGIKPLYYWCGGDRLIFASEPKAILAALGERPRPNIAAVSDYLVFSYVLGSETMFTGIHRLPPGSSFIADRSGMRVATYWDPSFEPEPGRRAEEWGEELRGLLRDSIRLQVRSDVPLGAHLSGGLDSSTVCCLAAEHIPSIQTFTARFPEGGFFDETAYARLVAEHIAADQLTIEPPAVELTELLPRLMYHLDEPVEGPAIVGKYHVAELVGRHRKVVLGGQGGDELFGGYDWYVKDLFTAASFGGRHAVGNRPTVPFLWQALREESLLRLGKSLFKNFGVCDVKTVFCRNWERLPSARLARILPTNVRNGYATPEERFLEAYARVQAQRDGDRMFKFDMRHYLAALLTSEDRLSMAFSVESRVPLLDYRIAELAARAGFELKTRPGHAKLLLRLAVADILPSAILARRDKRGFPTPIGAWLMDPKLRLLDSLVFNDNPFARRYFDLDYVRRLLRARLHLGSDWQEQLWRILCVASWGLAFRLS